MVKSSRQPCNLMHISGNPTGNVAGCVADGTTAQEAFDNIQLVLSDWLETAREEGREIPSPLTLEILAETGQMAQKEMHEQIEKTIRETVVHILQKIEEEKPNRDLSGWPGGNYSRFNILEKQKA